MESIVNQIANELKERSLGIAPRIPTIDEQAEWESEIVAKHGRRIVERAIDSDGKPVLVICK